MQRSPLGKQGLINGASWLLRDPKNHSHDSIQPQVDSQFSTFHGSDWPFPTMMRMLAAMQRCPADPKAEFMMSLIVISCWAGWCKKSWNPENGRGQECLTYFRTNPTDFSRPLFRYSWRPTSSQSGIAMRWFLAPPMHRARFPALRAVLSMISWEDKSKKNDSYDNKMPMSTMLQTPRGELQIFKERIIHSKSKIESTSKVMTLPPNFSNSSWTWPHVQSCWHYFKAPPLWSFPRRTQQKSWDFPLRPCRSQGSPSLAKHKLWILVSGT